MVHLRQALIMKKSFIVTDIQFDTKFKSEQEIKDLEFKALNAEGVWFTEGRSKDACEAGLFDKVQDYMGVYLTSLEYTNNKPHALTSFM